MSDIAIKVENLSKIYKLYDKPIERMKEALSISKKKYSRNHYALKDISFEVQKGEVIGIIGTNGSGKSTILKIITGVLNPTSGRVEVNGKISALLELGAGFNPEYTGMENIYLNGTMMGYSKEEMESKVQPILDFADIGEFINQPVKTYSSGMFARLAFAVAINVEPDILIVDEALAVGDTRFQIKCMNRMKEMMQGGVTILFVSHDVSSIRRFCSKAIWINKGSVKKIGEVNTVADLYADFLRCGEIDNAEVHDLEEVQVKDDGLPEFIPATSNEVIAEIIDVSINNAENRECNVLGYSESVSVNIVYDVYDDKIENPVLGIALFSIDDDYICGVNTLLDEVSIPWKYGRNRFSITYPYGLRVLGGKYYFDAAIREQTATINIDYKKAIKEITVTSDYVAEGRLVIPHIWQDKDKLM